MSNPRALRVPMALKSLLDDCRNWIGIDALDVDVFQDAQSCK